MFQAMLSSTDYAAHDWPAPFASEPDPAGQSPTPCSPTPGVGHNGPPGEDVGRAEESGIGHDQPHSGSFQGDADAVKRAGTIVTSFKRLGLALDDPRCQRPHIRILYRLMKCLNRETGTTYIGRKALADDAGLDIKTVENVLYDLRRWGHIDWEKRSDHSHKGKTSTTRCLSPGLPKSRSPRRSTRSEVKVPVPAGTRSTRPNGYSIRKYPPQRVRKYPSGRGQ